MPKPLRNKVAGTLPADALYARCAAEKEAIVAAWPEDERDYGHLALLDCLSREERMLVRELVDTLVAVRAGDDEAEDNVKAQLVEVEVARAEALERQADAEDLLFRIQRGECPDALRAGIKAYFAQQ